MNLVKTIVIDEADPVLHVSRVHGGDINTAWCLHTKEHKYFVKVNDAASYPGMFKKEADGLDAISKTGTVKVPQVIKLGVKDGRQYIVLEWLEREAPVRNFWDQFGKALASLHRQQQLHFGWHEDNYIGSLHQKNTQHQKWLSFCYECRILPLVEKLFDSGKFSKKEVEAAEHMCAISHNLFPDEPAALLHGDLWSGNFMAANNGLPAIYDPAVYFGHREMDIGMTKLFGGFHLDFYRAYNEVYPLESGWEQRLPQTQLYPLLVHAVLFGGHYVSNAAEILKRF